jgi:hypothetical protein
MNESPEQTEPLADPGKMAIPGKDEQRGKLHKWIPLVRGHISNVGDIPTPLDLVRTAANDSGGKALLFAASEFSRTDLESCLGDKLTRAPADVAVRAVYMFAFKCAIWRSGSYPETAGCLNGAACRRKSNSLGH